MKDLYNISVFLKIPYRMAAAQCVPKFSIPLEIGLSLNQPLEAAEWVDWVDEDHEEILFLDFREIFFFSQGGDQR